MKQKFLKNKVYILEEGFSTINIVLLFIYISAIALSAARKLNYYIRYIYTERNIDGEKKRMNSVLYNSVFEKINGDDFQITEELILDTIDNDILVKLLPMSKKLDFNFCPLNILDNLYADKIFSGEFESLYSEYFGTNRQVVCNPYLYFPAESVQKILDCFNFFEIMNINLVDLDQLNKILEFSGIDSLYRSKVISHLRFMHENKLNLSDEIDFSMLFGVYKEIVRDFLVYHPILNINSVDEKLLPYIFSYLGIKNFNTKAEMIVRLRNNKNIEKYNIESLFTVNELKLLLSVFSFRENYIEVQIINKQKNIEMISHLLKSDQDDSFKVKETIWRLK